MIESQNSCGNKIEILRLGEFIEKGFLLSKKKNFFTGNNVINPNDFESLLKNVYLLRGKREIKYTYKNKNTNAKIMAKVFLFYKNRREYYIETEIEWLYSK